MRKQSKKRGDQRFKTTSVLVLDEDKEKEYVELGVKLESTIVDIPETLKDASRVFTEIVALVDGDDGLEYTIPEIEERYRNTKDED